MLTEIIVTIIVTILVILVLVVLGLYFLGVGLNILEERIEKKREQEISNKDRI